MTVYCLMFQNQNHYHSLTLEACKILYTYILYIDTRDLLTLYLLYIFCFYKCLASMKIVFFFKG